MSNLSFFEFKSTRVRTVIIKGLPAFCLSDSLLAMNSKTRPSDAKLILEEHLGHGVVINYPIIDALGREQYTFFIFESGLTFLLSRSRTEAGKQLNRLIHTEILPSIRQTGKYQINDDHSSSEQIFLKVALIIDESFKNTTIKPELISSLKLNAASQIMPDLTKYIEPSRQLLINATAQEHRLLTPTEIGKQLGISAIAVNKLLIDRGLQRENGDRKSRKDSKYLPTDRGSEFSDLTLASGSGNDSTTYQQLRWYESVVNVLN